MARPKKVSDLKKESGPTGSFYLDCKTVRIFAYSSTREQSNKRSGVRLKTESQTGRDAGRVSFARVRLLRLALPISLLILRKRPTVLQSSFDSAFRFLFHNIPASRNSVISIPNTIFFLNTTSRYVQI